MEEGREGEKTGVNTTGGETHRKKKRFKKQAKQVPLPVMSDSSY